MDGNSNLEPRDLLELARQGDAEALGSLLVGYRRYVELMAHIQRDRSVQPKIAPSDIAQETFVQALRSFDQFRGSTEAELLQWLRSIAASKMAMASRHFHTQKHDVRLEGRLGDEMDRWSDRVATWLTPEGSSPSQQASRREQAVVLANALAELGADYREVILLRHFDELQFSDIAARMGRSINSVKNTWARAIRKLRELIVESSSS